jgi:hypothetical protein
VLFVFASFVEHRLLEAEVIILDESRVEPRSEHFRFPVDVRCAMGDAREKDGAARIQM